MVWRSDANGRISRSLGTLIDQVDARWPKRDRSSDGTIGNAAHQATKSDHNKDSHGIVRALDITNDPANGVNARAIAQAILDSRDTRLSYVISNKQIARSYPKTGTTPWQWSPYTGLNDHTHHCHVSVVSDDKIADDTRPWLLPGANMQKPPNFRSLAGGFFSSTPFDTSIPTSIRTNNPGALNASAWVKSYPGYVGDKVTSMSGASANNTAIFETPEQGVAVWWELMKRYRAAGAITISQIINKYGGTGQDYSAYVKFVVGRMGLPSTYEIKLSGDDATLTKFAKAMWRYEAGKETPLTDAQIAYGFALARKGGGAGAAVGTGVAIGAGGAGVVVANKIKNDGLTAGNVVLIGALMIAAGIGIYFLVKWLRK